MDFQNEDEFLRYGPAARLLGLPIGSLYGLVSKKQVPHVRLNKRIVLFSKRELMTFLEARRVDVGQAIGFEKWTTSKGKI